MICIICRQAELTNSFTSITFERDEFKLIVNNIPAQICPGCGESIVDENTALRLLNIAEEVMDEGLFEDVREYTA